MLVNLNKLLYYRNTSFSSPNYTTVHIIKAINKIIILKVLLLHSVFELYALGHTINRGRCPLVCGE